MFLFSNPCLKKIPLPESSIIWRHVASLSFWEEPLTAPPAPPVSWSYPWTVGTWGMLLQLCRLWRFFPSALENRQKMCNSVRIYFPKRASSSWFFWSYFHTAFISPFLFVLFLVTKGNIALSTPLFISLFIPPPHILMSGMWFCIFLFVNSVMVHIGIWGGKKMNKNMCSTWSINVLFQLFNTNCAMKQ